VMARACRRDAGFLSDDGKRFGRLNGARRENLEILRPMGSRKGIKAKRHRSRGCWTCGNEAHKAAACPSRPDIEGRRQKKSWDGEAVSKAEQAEAGRPEPKTIGDVLEDLAGMLSSSAGKGMLSVSVPQALVPKFQLLMKLAQLRKQGVDVLKFFAGDQTIQNQDLAEQVVGSEVCNEPEGNMQGEDSELTEEAALTTVPEDGDANESDFPGASSQPQGERGVESWVWWC